MTIKNKIFVRIPTRILPGIIMLVILFTGNIGAAVAQDVDQQFMLARESAFNEDYTRARELLSGILETHPDYHDARILKARTYAWEGDYGRARELLEETRQRAPRNRDALFALIDVEMWDQNYPRAINHLDMALMEQPNNTHLLFRKALALKESGDETAAVVILNQILDLDPSYTEARELLNSIESNRLVNHMGLGYRGHYFPDATNVNPWHLFYAELGRRIPFTGPLTARLNVANRKYENTTTNETDEIYSYQIELDAYPTIRPGTYLYLNVGYSPDSELFPVTRFGFELFQALPASWEASAGFRLLNFDDKDLLILTGSISKYYNKYLFSLRPYFSFSSVGDDPTGQSYFLTIRRFFTSPEHYLSLTLGRGYSADIDKYIGGEIYDLGGTLFEAMLMYQQKLSNRFLFRVGAGYKFYEEDELWGNPVILEGGITYRF